MYLYQKKNKNKRKCSDIQSDTNTQEPFLNAPRFRNDKTLIFYDWKFNVQLNQQIEWYPIIEIDFEKYGHKNHSKFNTYFHLVIVSLLSHLQKKISLKMWRNWDHFVKHLYYRLASEWIIFYSLTSTIIIINLFFSLIDWIGGYCFDANHHHYLIFNDYIRLDLFVTSETNEIEREHQAKLYFF